MSDKRGPFFEVNYDMGHNKREKREECICPLFFDIVKIVVAFEKKFLYTQLKVYRLRRNKMPKISVIMPVYNVEKYLKRAVKSVLSQTFEDFELICVNDGSPDNSLKILEEYGAKDARIKIISQENKGLSVARNVGLKEACGEWVYFFDSDDALHPQAFELCLMAASRYDADMVCFDYQKSDGKSYHPTVIDAAKVKAKVSKNPLDYAFKTGAYRISFNVWTKLYKRAIVENISFIKGIHFEDCPHTFAVLQKHPKTAIMQEKLYFYTVNPASISNQKASPKQIEDYFEVIKYTYGVYQNTNDLKVIRKYLFPKLLRTQLRRLKKAPNDVRPLMTQVFKKELWYLADKNMLSPLSCGIFKYLEYMKILKA